MEIQVQAAGLNFKDVLNVLGLLPALALGLEVPVLGLLPVLAPVLAVLSAALVVAALVAAIGGVRAKGLRGGVPNETGSRLCRA